MCSALTLKSYLYTVYPLEVNPFQKQLGGRLPPGYDRGRITNLHSVRVTRPHGPSVGSGRRASSRVHAVCALLVGANLKFFKGVQMSALQLVPRRILPCQWGRWLDQRSWARDFVTAPLSIATPSSGTCGPPQSVWWIWGLLVLASVFALGFILGRCTKRTVNVGPCNVAHAGSCAIQLTPERDLLAGQALADLVTPVSTVRRLTDFITPPSTVQAFDISDELPPRHVRVSRLRRGGGTLA